MDALCDADPLGTGRRMVLRWGKNVKKTVKFGTGGVPTNLRKKPRENEESKGAKSEKDTDRNTFQEEINRPYETVGDVAESKSPKQKQTQEKDSSSLSPNPPDETTVSKNKEKMMRPNGRVYDPVEHSATSIVVIAPTDPRRLKFITTVASFVAKDGSLLEQKLIETQSYNSDFYFLTPRDDDSDDDEYFAEHIFYR